MAFTTQQAYGIGGPQLYNQQTQGVNTTPIMLTPPQTVPQYTPSIQPITPQTLSPALGGLLQQQPQQNTQGVNQTPIMLTPPQTVSTSSIQPQQNTQGIDFSNKVDKPNLTGYNLYQSSPAVVQGMSSGNFAGIGSGLGTAAGAVFGGPAGAVVGGAVGGVAGGILDYWLNEKEKERLANKEKKAAAAQERWQRYQLALEKRSMAQENEEQQYSRDSAMYQRLVAAQTEALKTKNSILQVGNLYRARKGRNWYGPNGIQGQVRGNEIPTNTTAKDLGYTGTTMEQVSIPTPIRGFGG